MDRRRSTGCIRSLLWLGALGASLGLAAACAPRDRGVPDDSVPGLPEEGAAPAPRTARSPRPAEEPPPISGGTLLVTADGTAVAADPDRDRLWIVNLNQRRLRAQVQLRPGDEPGRLVEDGHGRVHVVLRGGGALVTLDPASGALSGRRAVCGAPRGLAYEPGRDLLHIACAEGLLVTLQAADRAPVRELRLDPDLRDVVVQGSRLFVSQFRAARLLEIGPDGSVLRSAQPPALVSGGQSATPSVAWRTLALPGGAVAMLHQRASGAPVAIREGGYNVPASACKTGLVHGTVTLFQPADAMAVAPQLPAAVLPVDLAVSRDGAQLAVVAAGNGVVHLVPTAEFARSTPCAGVTSSVSLPLPAASVVAVAFDGQGRAVVQTREPAALFVLPDQVPIVLGGESRASFGHGLFHGATQNLLACASCHPEAGDDGRVWPFEGIGDRRTQNPRGGILGTEPFHWNGDMTSFTHLANEVLTRRMSGPAIDGDQSMALARWLDAQPALPAIYRASQGAIDRGSDLFHDSVIGCASCHSGPRLTNNQTVDVGSGGKFQVPSLTGVAMRAPFLHNGCAATLQARFGPCGGDRHGQTAQLSEGQVGDLVAYLETLSYKGPPAWKTRG